MWDLTYTQSDNDVKMEGCILATPAEFEVYLGGSFISCLQRQIGVFPRNLIRDIAETQFEADAIEQAMSLTYIIDVTKWGEVFAACQLEQRYATEIPCPTLWADRNPRGSSSGADIIGFTEDDGNRVFLFGEVKTSSDSSSPPSVIYGKGGLISQLESLIGERGRFAAQWMWKQSIGRSWNATCKEAIRLFYVHNAYKIVGILVRDTEPESRDLDAVFEKCRSYVGPSFLLIAFYLPLAMADCVAQSSSLGGVHVV